jgi:hypothetical protein
MYNAANDECLVEYSEIRYYVASSRVNCYDSVPTVWCWFGQLGCSYCYWLLMMCVKLANEVSSDLLRRFNIVFFCSRRLIQTFSRVVVDSRIQCMTRETLQRHRLHHRWRHRWICHKLTLRLHSSYPQILGYAPIHLHSNRLRKTQEKTHNDLLNVITMISSWLSRGCNTW